MLQFLIITLFKCVILARFDSLKAFAILKSEDICHVKNGGIHDI